MPPQHKYTWDIQTVLDYIDGLGENSALDMKTLSKKTVTLVALATGCRGSEIANMWLALVKKGLGKIKKPPSLAIGKFFISHFCRAKVFALLQP